MVVNFPWWRNGPEFARPHNLRVRKYSLPPKNPGNVGARFLFNVSPFGSLGPVQMLWSFRSVNAGTHTTPFESGLSRGPGNSSLVKSTERVGASPTCRLPAGLYGPGSVYIQPLLYSGSFGM